MDWKEIILAVIIASLVIGFGFLALNKMEIDNTYVQCCNGSICTDTYYDYKTNLCHLVLCERLPFAKDCTYEGANISYVGIN